MSQAKTHKHIIMDYSFERKINYIKKVKKYKSQTEAIKEAINHLYIFLGGD